MSARLSAWINVRNRVVTGLSALGLKSAKADIGSEANWMSPSADKAVFP